MASLVLDLDRNKWWKLLEVVEIVKTGSGLTPLMYHQYSEWNWNIIITLLSLSCHNFLEVSQVFLQKCLPVDSE